MPSWKQNALSYLSWAVCLAYVGLLLSLPISNITLFLLLGCCLVVNSVASIRTSIQSSLPIQLLILFYVLHIVGLLYTQNIDNGLFVLEKKVTLLVLPIILFPALQQLPTQDKSDLLLRLGLITIASSLAFVAIALLKAFLYNYGLAFHRDYFPSIPYVFYAMYFSTGSLLLLNSIYERCPYSRRKIFVMFLLTAYSLGFLVLLSSKTGIIAYIFGLTYFLWLRLPSRRLFYLSFVAILLSLTLSLIVYPTTLNRFVELKKNLAVITSDKLSEHENFTGLNLRLFFWRISLTQLLEDKTIVTGVGTGDAQDYLDRAYEKHDLDNFGYMHFDPHNEWVMMLLQLGILGVGCFGAVYGVGWWMATKLVNLYFIFFLWSTLCFSFSESILESNKGIVFFALFFCVLHQPSAKNLSIRN